MWKELTPKLQTANSLALIKHLFDFLAHAFFFRFLARAANFRRFGVSARIFVLPLLQSFFFSFLDAALQMSEHRMVIRMHYRQHPTN